MTYLYKVIGFDKEEGERFGSPVFHNAAAIFVEARTEAEALEKAKSIIKKPLYRVVEGHQRDLTQQAQWEKQHELNQQIANGNEAILSNNIKVREAIESLSNAIEKFANAIKK